MSDYKIKGDKELESIKDDIDSYTFTKDKKRANAYTREFNRNYLKDNGIDPLTEDNPEYEQMHANCILDLNSEDDFLIRDEEGNVILDVRPYYFIKNEETPDSVNPSLFNMAKGNICSGVFSYCEGNIIQVRGVNDNMTLVRSRSGWIMIDVPSSDEKLIAGMYLAEKATGESIRDKLVAVIVGTGITDIYGHFRAGVDGFKKILGGRRIPVYTSPTLGRQMSIENVYSNVINMRKAPFQFGSESPGPEGYVTAGFTVGIPGGSAPFTADDFIPNNGTFELDGIEMESTYIGDIGTPADVMLYIPKYRALWVSELLIDTLHNIYTVRGARPRDAKVWADHIYDAYIRYGDKTDVILQATNWTHQNTEKSPEAIKDYLLTNAGMYKYINDQTLHLASKGYRVEEIVDNFKYPKSLSRQLVSRPFYGSLEMSIRGIYNTWFGSADGNPVNLHRQTKSEEAKQFIEYVGSEELVLEKAYDDYRNNRYQRAIEALDRIMFYNPENERARLLYADILEQMGYQAESGTSRNAYLHGAEELREGIVRSVPAKDQIPDDDYVEFASAMSDEHMLEYLSVSLDGEKAQHEDFAIDLTIERDDGQLSRHLVTLRHGALLHAKVGLDEDFPEAVRVRTKPGILTKLVSHRLSEVEEWIETDDIEVLRKLESCLEDPLDNLGYPIMEKF